MKKISSRPKKAEAIAEVIRAADKKSESREEYPIAAQAMAVGTTTVGTTKETADATQTVATEKIEEV